MKLRPASAILLAALLVTGGPARAARAQEQQQQEAAAAETLTPDERREAGEFLLRLDERWRGARDFSALFDEAFVGDFLQTSLDNESHGLHLVTVGESLREQLTAAEWRRAYVVDLDFIYVMGRLCLTFEQREKHRRAEERAAAAQRPAAAGKDSSDDPDDDDTAEAPLEKILSPAAVEVFRSNPLLAGALSDGREGGGDGEDSEITTREQLDALLSTFELATKKMRERVSELEEGLPGAPVSAVPREDEGEGEWPELRLVLSGSEWKRRPAGTRIVCGYLSNLHVDLVKEGGRYRVLAAYVED